MPNTPAFSLAALFADRPSAEAAMADLEISGFPVETLHLFAHDPGSQETFPIIPPPAPTLGGISASGIPAFTPGVGMALATLRVNEEDLEICHARIAAGEALLALEAGERTPIARTILERNGGEIVGG